eukprot:CAMPEP_0201989898 /NCGR_PEP_ID=MMETSP0904-20121228/93094_1 /ASSEMBLY_ACC=CAM_ASM_000553 /TAXON_ID=420261 /ORGANISM="Thalassiosira antarctica, Strain CCMP982" /LENGTH=119 /DNA_ID=CAMNT_0048544139 /DNA_START=357 /DNA_END=713 /DNA_ORIENTATION=-
MKVVTSSNEVLTNLTMHAGRVIRLAMNKVTNQGSLAEVWNNETAASYPDSGDTLGVSLGYMLIGWLVFFAAAMYWRQTEAMDESKNNWGLFQWSSMFYCEGGAVMDFINALPHIMNLVP